MGHWSYGLIQRKLCVSPEEEHDELILCEVYFNEKGKPHMYASVNWNDIQEGDKKMILRDLKAQMNNNVYWFKDEDFDNED
jgi:hypothetical protein